MCFDFIAEMGEHIAQGHCGGLAQPAVRKLYELVANLPESLQVLHFAMALAYFSQDLISFLCAHSARSTLSTAFLAEEIEQHACQIHHTNFIVANQ